MELTDRFVSNKYALIVGPSTLIEPLPSWAVDDIEMYTTNDVLDSLAAIPGVRIVSEHDVDLSRWSAVWESNGARISFNNVEEFDDENRSFGKIHLDCDCFVADVISIWSAIQSRFPGVWLYSPESWLLTRDAFLAGDMM